VIGVDDDMYLDQNGLMPSKIPRQQLHMDSTLVQGRFAIVRKARLDSDKGRTTVAAKALKSKQL